MTPAEQTASLQVGDVIRRVLDGTTVTVDRFMMPVARFAIDMGWWVKVENEGGA